MINTFDGPDPSARRRIKATWGDSEDILPSRHPDGPKHDEVLRYQADVWLGYRDREYLGRVPQFSIQQAP